VPGHWRRVEPRAPHAQQSPQLSHTALAHQCKGACGVHAHQHDKARKSNVPVSDFGGFWGAFGCSCFAF
jgi:hypothetical protein